MGPVTQWHIISKAKHVPAVDTLVLAVTRWAADFTKAILVYEFFQWRLDYALWDAVQKASWDDVILDEAFKKDLKEDYRTFFSSEKVYHDLGVPWKRGLIFYGPAGNGKTISLKAMMKDAGAPTLYVKSLGRQMVSGEYCKLLLCWAGTDHVSTSSSVYACAKGGTMCVNLRGHRLRHRR